jgi:predicted dehydrogenase
MANKKIRELRVFQHNAFLSLDYQRQEVSCYRKQNGRVERVVQRAEKKEPLREQLISFVECIRHRTRPVASGYEGREALKVALKISELVNHGCAA